MSPQKLIYMANQIAHAFRSRPHDEAVAATAEHISNFWEPRMRAQLLQLLKSDPKQFDGILQEASERIRPVSDRK